MAWLPIPTVAFSGALLGGWIADQRRTFRPQRRPYSARECEHLLGRAVERAMAPEDLDYLRGQPLETRDLSRCLKRGRKQFLKLYLQQTRASFDASARVAREFAADSDAPELAMAVFRQTLRFNVLWIALRLSLVFRLAGPAWRLTESLTRAARLSAQSGAAEEFIRSPQS